MSPASEPPGSPGLDDVESSLTWIWGAPRSGSSWLLDLLCHPARVARDEPLGFEAPGPGSEPVTVIPADELSFGNHLAPWDGHPVEVFGEWLPGSVINFSEHRPTYLLAEAHAATWRPWMRGLALARLDAVRRSAAEADLAAPDAAIVVKETPSGHAADRVMDLLPRSRALLLVRDPRDVVDSLLHALRPGGFMARQFGVAFGGDGREAGVAWAAQTWAMSVDVGRRALERHDEALGRTVRYEDLIADPAGTLHGLLGWIGAARERESVEAAVAELAFETLPAGAVGDLKRNRSATPGAWRENLSEEEVATVDEIAGDRLERYGYERS
jgi:hypothetical protein